MSTQVATLPTKQEKRSIVAELANRYGMEPAAFADTISKTVFPKDGTNEEFLAFLLVAKEYNLNPITKEIYAFPKKGGGIQPIVSIDGWLNIINSHPQLNGIEFDDHIEGKGVTAITCRLWRKDREKPIVVTEYLEECAKATEPWQKWPRRMLRHKALIQCARYAFGFAGIVDPDEAERMGVDVSPMHTIDHDDRKSVTPPPVPPAPTSARGPDFDPNTGEVWDDGPPPVPPQADPLDIPPDLDRRKKPEQSGVNAEETEWLREFGGALSGCEDMASLFEAQAKIMAPHKGKVSPATWKQAADLVQSAVTRISQTILDAG